MLSLLKFASLVVPAAAISTGLILDAASTGSNVWVELEYSVTVPPAPPASVTTGPWFFWCGLQPGTTAQGVVQPVLQWGQAASSYVNPTPPFAQIWAMVLWYVPASGKNNGASIDGPAIWAAQGDKITSFMTYNAGTWTQTARVVSGAAAGQNAQAIANASQFFQTDSAGDSNAAFFLCESELDGQQTNQWSFDLTFSDITLRAKTSSGVAALCGTIGSGHIHNDGNGVHIANGFSMINSTTCHWDSWVLIPPGNCASK